jgi:hypothetical protein
MHEDLAERIRTIVDPTYHVGCDCAVRLAARKSDQRQVRASS